MQIYGVKNIRKYLDEKYEKNLEGWYERNTWAVEQNRRPWDFPEYLTRREIEDRIVREEKAELERAESIARQHCNPNWGHTYGCDGCCNYGIDYDDSKFATFP